MSKETDIKSKNEALKCERGKTPRCKTYKSEKYKASGLYGTTVCTCASVPFAQKNNMRIRIYEPSPSLWYYMYNSKGLYYIAGDDYDGEKSLYITLAYGSRESSVIESIGFARGIPRAFKYDPGQTIDPSHLRSQDAIVNWEKIRMPRPAIYEFEAIFRRLMEVGNDASSEEERVELLRRMLVIQNAAIEKLNNSHYMDYIIKQMEREWGVKLSDVSIVPKDEGFQLVFRCVGVCKI